MKKFMTAMTMAMVHGSNDRRQAAAAAMRQMIRQVEIFPSSASISMDSTHLWITVERAFSEVSGGSRSEGRRGLQDSISECRLR